jgi:putative RNA 2'-phosphotransferase
MYFRQSRVLRAKRLIDLVITMSTRPAMAGDGLLFYRSENGVWLTDAVPPQYLKRTIDHT